MPTNAEHAARAIVDAIDASGRTQLVKTASRLAFEADRIGLKIEAMCCEDGHQALCAVLQRLPTERSSRSEIVWRHAATSMAWKIAAALAVKEIIDSARAFHEQSDG